MSTDTTTATIDRIDSIDDLPTMPRGARSLLLTMLGEFVYPTGGSVWTSTIVAGLDAAGITERNARQAVARLGEQGIVRSERHGRRTRWHLTEPGTELLAGGTERIYSLGRRAGDWDGNWLLVICAIPETQRAVRHRFRTQLAFEGFGFLSPTIAVSPHTEREAAATALISELGLDEIAMSFVSTTAAMTTDADVLTGAWDLDGLERSYAGFLDEFDHDPGHHEPARTFGDMLHLVDAWRRFPFADPELPLELMPESWIGTRAHEAFDRRRSAQRPTAMAWFADVEAAAS
jgi:phenylacetic acid degradation operon negative regulatory protein